MVKIFVIALLLTLVISSVQAQGDCPEDVKTALDAAQQFCGSLGRNEVCYGNTLVSATGWDSRSLDAFTAPGNITSLFDIQALVTAPLDTVNGNWGVALLSMQANLPDTMPGQNVTFIVFGDAQLSSDVPQENTELPFTLTATTIGTPNVRSAPSTGADLLATLDDQAQVLVIGRTEGGNWYQIVYQSAARWVSKDYLAVDGDTSGLPIVPRAEWTNPLLKYSAPMQSFHIDTSVRGTECDELPPSGVVVQAPTNTTVNFMVNGVELSVGSTGMLNIDESSDALKVATLGGTIGVKAGDELALVEPGNITQAVEGSAPTTPKQYEYADVHSLPLTLLPEAVTPPPPAGTPASVFACNFSGNSIRKTISSTEPIIFSESLGSSDSDGALRVREGSTVTMTLDGEAVPLWGVSDIYEKNNTLTADGQQAGTSMLYDWWFVVPHPQPGNHDLTLTWTYQETRTYTCSIVVE